MEYTSMTLPNGIRLIHASVDSPVAHCGVVINTGSRDEKPEEQGMAHFIEHTIFKGTVKRKAYHIISRLEDVGGEMNAYTSKEETAIHASFLCEYYERTVELFSDILIDSTFPEKELKKEQEVIVDEINSYNDTPSELIFDEFEEMIYKGHPMGRNILGTPDLVRSFQASDIRHFMAENYHTDQMVICSVGNIPAKKFFHLAQRYFERLKANLRTENRNRFTTYRPIQKTVEKGTFQAHCILGGEAFDVYHPDRLPLVLLNSILGGQSGNSRLNLSLRERNGIAYNLESSYTAYTDTGTLTIYFGTDPENLERALNLIDREIRLLRDKALGELQLSKSRKQLIGQLAMSQENHEDLMLAIGKSMLVFNKVESLQDIYKRISEITAPQLLDVANRILNPENLSGLIYK
ncbi:MAG: insulinase family protein [Prolixibacteraceae bacterium]|jgi:predicted Zn-dependent peptidase|nr:insulinase family protein [Prolixibacteraceae bacterium]